MTADELPDPQALKIACHLNGEEVQASSTANMVFPVAELISYISRRFTLRPGELVFTGTPRVWARSSRVSCGTPTRSP